MDVERGARGEGLPKNEKKGSGGMGGLWDNILTKNSRRRIMH